MQVVTYGESSIYLKRSLREVLPRALSEVCMMRPPDPIEFLARCLYRAVDCDLYFQEKAVFEREMGLMAIEMKKEQQQRHNAMTRYKKHIAELKHTLYNMDRKPTPDQLVEKKPSQTRRRRPTRVGSLMVKLSEPRRSKKSLFEGDLLGHVSEESFSTVSPESQKSEVASPPVMVETIVEPLLRHHVLQKRLSPAPGVHGVVSVHKDGISRTQIQEDSFLERSPSSRSSSRTASSRTSRVRSPTYGDEEWEAKDSRTEYVEQDIDMTETAESLSVTKSQKKKFRVSKVRKQTRSSTASDLSFTSEWSSRPGKRMKGTLEAPGEDTDSVLERVSDVLSGTQRPAGGTIIHTTKTRRKGKTIKKERGEETADLAMDVSTTYTQAEAEEAVSEEENEDIISGWRQRPSKETSSDEDEEVDQYEAEAEEGVERERRRHERKMVREEEEGVDSEQAGRPLGKRKHKRAAKDRRRTSASDDQDESEMHARQRSYYKRRIRKHRAKSAEDIEAEDLDQGSSSREESPSSQGPTPPGSDSEFDKKKPGKRKRRKSSVPKKHVTITSGTPEGPEESAEEEDEGQEEASSYEKHGQSGTVMAESGYKRRGRRRSKRRGRRISVDEDEVDVEYEDIEWPEEASSYERDSKSGIVMAEHKRRRRRQSKKRVKRTSVDEDEVDVEYEDAEWPEEASSYERDSKSGTAMAESEYKRRGRRRTKKRGKRRSVDEDEVEVEYEDAEWPEEASSYDRDSKNGTVIAESEHKRRGRRRTKRRVRRLSVDEDDQEDTQMWKSARPSVDLTGEEAEREREGTSRHKKGRKISAGKRRVTRRRSSILDSSRRQSSSQFSDIMLTDFTGAQETSTLLSEVAADDTYQFPCTPVNCEWQLIESNILVCRHPVLGDIRSHPPSISAARTFVGWSNPSNYTWQAFYDPEVYAVQNPFLEDTRIRRKLKAPGP